MSANETRTAAPPGRMSRGWRIVLVVSLALNLAVAGMMAGALFSGHHPTGPTGTRSPGTLGFGPFTGALSREDREALRTAYAGRGPTIRELREAARQEAEAMAAALRAMPFEPAAVAALLDTQRGRADERFRLGQTLLIERIAAMTPEAREALAARLLDPPRKR